MVDLLHFMAVTPSEMFFDGWMSIIRTAVVGLIAYLALIVLLRVSGKARSVVLETDGSLSVIARSE